MIAFKHFPCDSPDVKNLIAIFLPVFLFWCFYYYIYIYNVSVFKYIPKVYVLWQ
jgi:hypothetical protein